MSSRKRPYPREQEYAPELNTSRRPHLFTDGRHSQPAIFVPSEASSLSFILQEPEITDSYLGPHVSKQSDFQINPSGAVNSLVPSPEQQQRSGYHETSAPSGFNSIEPTVQPHPEPSSSPLLPRTQESGSGALGPWWTFTLEETLDWSSLRLPGSPKPCVMTLADRPLSEVRLQSRKESSGSGSLPLAPERETYVSLDDVDEMSRFVERFLRNIHVLNPLIEPTFLRDQIAVVAELGLQWDSATCLLLIACACGAVSSNFNLDALEDYSAPSTSAHDYVSSREYFDAGRKRLGLLADDSSQIAVMCLFFTGVYYMCTLRPVAAWRSFNSASIMCRHYLQGAKGDAAAPEKWGARHQRQQRNLDSKLYWSCVKSEREVAIELGIRPSNSSLMEYTNTLPSPPTPPIFDANLIESLSPEMISPASHGFSDTVTAGVYKQSWFYYLTDITIRKLEMQVDEYVHRDGEPPPSSTLAVREAFYQKIMTTLSDADERITAHYSTLPDIIAFDMDEQYHSVDTLREYLRYRMLATRQNLHRPALYIVLHHPDDIANIAPPLREGMIAIANRALVFDIHFVRHAVTTHRAPGTWLLIRHVTRCALELLAAWKTHSPWLTVDPHWVEALQAFKVALRYWSRESADVFVYLNCIEQLQHG